MVEGREMEQCEVRREDDWRKARRAQKETNMCSETEGKKIRKGRERNSWKKRGKKVGRERKRNEERGGEKKRPRKR